MVRKVVEDAIGQALGVPRKRVLQPALHHEQGAVAVAEIPRCFDQAAIVPSLYDVIPVVPAASDDRPDTLLDPRRRRVEVAEPGCPYIRVARERQVEHDGPSDRQSQALSHRFRLDRANRVELGGADDRALPLELRADARARKALFEPRAPAWTIEGDTVGVEHSRRSRLEQDVGPVLEPEPSRLRRGSEPAIGRVDRDHRIRRIPAPAFREIRGPAITRHPRGTRGKDGYRVGELRGLGTATRTAPVVPALDVVAATDRFLHDRPEEAIVVLSQDQYAEPHRQDRRNAS